MHDAGHWTPAHLLARALRPGARSTERNLRHLAACEQCQGDLRRLSIVVEAVRSPDEEPPRRAVQAAFDVGAPTVPSRRDRSRFLPARLLFDSAPLRMVAQVRAPQAGREQLWRTRRADVDLQFVGPGPGTSACLLGQVLPRGRTVLPRVVGWIWLHEPGRSPRRFEILPTGEFALPAPGRRWTLTLEWGGLRMRVEKR